MIVTPGEILAEMESVDAAVRQLGGEVGAVPVTAAFKQAWSAFAEEWRQFYEAHKGLSQRLWTEVYRQALAFRRRVEEWYAAFAREGWRARALVKPDGAADQGSQLPAPPVLAPEPAGYSLGTIAWIAAGAALLSGLVVHASKE